MFNLANLGFVAWPVKVPDFEQTDHENGGNVMRVIDVRFEIMDRAEIRALDVERAKTLSTIAAERFAEIGSDRPPEGATDEQSEAFYRGRAARIEAATNELAAKFEENEVRQVERLRKRVKAYRAEQGGEWVDFKPDELDQLLRLVPYIKAFDEGLLAASRGARAKN